MLILNRCYQFAIELFREYLHGQYSNAQVILGFLITVIEVDIRNYVPENFL